MLLHWFEDLQNIIFRNSVANNSFAGFNPELLTQRFLFGQCIEQFLNIHLPFLVLCSTQMLIEIL